MGQKEVENNVQRKLFSCYVPREWQRDDNDDHKAARVDNPVSVEDMAIAH